MASELIIRGKGREVNVASLIASISLMLAAVIGQFPNKGVTGFHIIGGVAGCALSAVQSVSRAMVSTFSPPGRSAELWRLRHRRPHTVPYWPGDRWLVAAETALWFEKQGDGTSFLWFSAHQRGGPLAEQLGQQVAIPPVIAFPVVGLALLLSVNEARRRAALPPEPSGGPS